VQHYDAETITWIGTFENIKAKAEESIEEIICNFIRDNNCKK